MPKFRQNSQKFSCLTAFCKIFLPFCHQMPTFTLDHLILLTPLHKIELCSLISSLPLIIKQDSETYKEEQLGNDLKRILNHYLNFVAKMFLMTHEDRGHSWRSLFCGSSFRPLFRAGPRATPPLICTNSA